MEDASSKLLAKGIVERIGLPEGDLTHKPVGKEPFELHQPIPDHTTGIKLVLDALTDPDKSDLSGGADCVCSHSRWR